jgi:dTDP-4-amino-4,6-dideoxygalactose transaminase
MESVGIHIQQLSPRPMTPRTEYLPFGRPNFGEEEIEAVSRVIRSGWIGMGPETITFEQELAAATGAPHVVTVNSCTSALFLALLAHGVGPGDEVICPSLTWCSTANAALYLGAKPVFCDIATDTLSVTPATIQAALSERTKAVIVVHYGGLPVEIDPLRAFLPKHVAVIEDAAHAFGARFADGRHIGSSGGATCFSFYANKNLSTGEGGAIALFDDQQAARLRSLRQHGLPHDAWKRFIDSRRLNAGQPDELGYKMNFTDLQAALGRVQLRRQPEFVKRRAEIARFYAQRLPGLNETIAMQAGLTGDRHARHLFVLRLPVGTDRDTILARMRELNIGASIHYTPLHLMRIYQSTAVLPVTEAVAPGLLTLPISASMTLANAQDVIAALNAALQEFLPAQAQLSPNA